MEMPEPPDVMFLTDNGLSQIINGVRSEIRIASSNEMNNGGVKYIRHDIYDAEVEVNMKGLAREESLRVRISELEAILEARGV